MAAGGGGGGTTWLRRGKQQKSLFTQFSSISVRLDNQYHTHPHYNRGVTPHKLSYAKSRDRLFPVFVCKGYNA